jgi:phenylpropionate dioxygenase-like ring-hydroxylating dioxygenase large terminal subunit
MKADEIRSLWQQAQQTVAGTRTQRGEAATWPVARYLDPARLEQERAALRRLPHAIGPASRLRSGGDWFTAELLGVPILAACGDDGIVRAFINVCRHRGALVAAMPADATASAASPTPPPACGSGRQRFVCPYHSWTYDGRGALIGRPHEADFAHAPRERSALVALPAQVRCGLVWVVPSPIDRFDWDAWFGPLAAALEGMGCDAASESPHESLQVHAANWKLLVDGSLETYHFQYAHRRTIAPYFHDNAVLQQSFGRHQRIVLPRKSLPTAADATSPVQSLQTLGRHAGLLHFFFPTTFLLWNGDHVSVFRLTPRDAGHTDVASWLLVPAADFARADASRWELNWRLFWEPLHEDFALGASIQRGLAGGANTALVFGTSEFAPSLFQAALDAAMHDLRNDVPCT